MRFFLIYFLIGGKLLYHMLVSAVQQHESVIITHTHTYIYIPSLLSLPLLSPSPRSRSSQSTRLDSLCFILFYFFSSTSLLLPTHPLHQPHACVLSSVTPWTAALQALLSMDFSRQEYWSGLPFPSPSLCYIATSH